MRESKRLLETNIEVNEESLVGRQWLISELNAWFEGGGKRACLSAPPGAGKSAVSQAFAQTVPGSMVVDFSHRSYALEWPHLPPCHSRRLSNLGLTNSQSKLVKAVR